MSLKGINTNKALDKNCWHYSNFIVFNIRIDFRMSLNFKITLRYFINSLWNKPQFMLSKNEAVQGNFQHQAVLWFTREEQTPYTKYLLSVILSQIKF